jgi:hypothetical protein
MRIKGMVCRRCISIVKDIFMQAGFDVTSITLGEVTYKPHTSDASLQKVEQQLIEEGFQPLGDKQSRIIARIKELVEQHLSGPEHHEHNFSQMVTAADGLRLGEYSLCTDRGDNIGEICDRAADGESQRTAAKSQTLAHRHFLSVRLQQRTPFFQPVQTHHRNDTLPLSPTPKAVIK